MINILINAIFLIALGIVQVSFLSTWPIPISSLNLILISVIFLTVIINYQRGLWWALGGGLFLELYSGLAFGLTTLGLLIMVIIINFLFNNFFTNRSFYSLMILGLIGTVSYNLIILTLSLIGLLFGLTNFWLSFDFSSQFIWQPIFNLIILAIIFFTYYISTGRLKNIFLFHPSSYEIKH
jgi:hypothetical protein